MDGADSRGLLPVEASHPDHAPLTVLAVWAKLAPGSSYTRQETDVIEIWEDRFGGRCVLAGDFNASLQGPSRKRHAVNLARLEQAGMLSAYHHHFDVAHGDEEAMTLRWIGPGGNGTSTTATS